jgi:PEP-CTERM motif
MKRLFWAVVMFLVVAAPSVYADDIPVLNVNITQATFTMFPNDGSGDNISFTLIGPGTKITGIGGTACFEWCSGPITDLSSVRIGDIAIGPFFTATIAGQTYDAFSELSLCCFFSSGGQLAGSVSGQVGTGNTFAELNLTLPHGSWSLQFVPVDGGFQFVRGELIAGTPPAPVPEPGTFALLATGLASIFGALRRK